MHTSYISDKGGLSLVEPHQVHGSIGAAAPETLGARVLELSSLLQTTLDIAQQVELFAKSLGTQLEVDGLEFTEPDTGLKHEVGRQSTPRATYNLTHESSDLGTLSFYRDIPFNGRELKLLENLLCALVYPLRNAMCYQAALRMASHDPLTGVQNRLAMDSALVREVDLAQRRGTPLSVLLIDADHFKRFNDDHGHAFGDDVLRALAKSMSSTVRRSDLLYRFGGEEFVVLAAQTGRDGAMLLAERIREAIASIRTVRFRDVELSVSIGVAELAEGESAADFFKRSDDAMYQAKRAGRNRAVAG